ncbi:MAG: hypothetical protein JST93_17515 [Acidobacteria bacterium]|nr:hypothetical protein [Acidobacteriota bacterium]
MRWGMTPRQLAAVSMGAFGVSVLSAVMWAITGDMNWTVKFFQYPGAWFLVFTCVAQLYLSYSVWKGFESGEPMEVAWFLLTMAAAVRLLGTSISQLLRPILMEYRWLDPTVVRDMGIVMSSPLMFLLLGCGLFLVLRVYRQLGLLRMLTKVDYLLIGLSVLFCLHQGKEVIEWLPDLKRRFNVFAMLNWASDPLLSLLLVESIILWRSGRHLAGGYIGHCYGAFAMAVMLTSLGNVGLWIEAWGLLPWPYRAVVWFVWIPAAAWFAVAPAYMAQGMARAMAGRAVVVGEARS